MVKEGGCYLGYRKSTDGDEERGVVVEGPLTHPELITRLFKLSGSTTQTYAYSLGQAILTITDEFNFPDWLKK
ncbi:hypothetical protein KJ707_03650 [Patescibacteria group bacterium]|nr:hypothetical protein [Patescibacteria group bacterium]